MFRLFERAFYALAMAHHVSQDGIIISRLLAISSRHTSHGNPEGADRAAAIKELREAATVTQKPQRGSPYPPRSTLRTDLLGEAAGAVLGSPPGEGHHQNQNRGALLQEAGADPEVTERAKRERAERAAKSGPPFSRSPSADPRQARPR